MGELWETKQFFTFKDSGLKLIYNVSKSLIESTADWQKDWKCIYWEQMHVTYMHLNNINV